MRQAVWTAREAATRYNPPALRTLPSTTNATTTLKRSDFGLGKFVPQVGDEIQIRITSQAAEANAYAEYLRAEAAYETATKK